MEPDLGTITAQARQAAAELLDVAKLEQGAFRSLAAQAVVTAYEKNSRIGK